jgi:hypothetical protein
MVMGISLTSTSILPYSLDQTQFSQRCVELFAKALGFWANINANMKLCTHADQLWAGALFLFAAFSLLQRTNLLTWENTLWGRVFGCNHLRTRSRRRYGGARCYQHLVPMCAWKKHFANGV